MASKGNPALGLSLVENGMAPVYVFVWGAPLLDFPPLDIQTPHFPSQQHSFFLHCSDRFK